MVSFDLVKAGSNMPKTGGSITPESDRSRSRHELEDLGDGVDDEEWDILRHYHPDRFDRRTVNRRLAALAAQPQER
ncbi:hypothetical protein WKW80_34755 [Variovorax humicola]|uniref:Uncharacterized protein n=1 Tax=Variovorax humicola TaxID=1769758 RepID=A0ABU8WAM7_9BURK